MAAKPAAVSGSDSAERRNDEAADAVSAARRQTAGGQRGRSDSVFDGDRSKVRFEQMPLAQLILRAQMAATQADFAVISGGGIRTSLAQGEISWRDLLQIQPFGNQVVSVTLTGKELLNYGDGGEYQSRFRRFRAVQQHQPGGRWQKRQRSENQWRAAATG